MGRNKIEFVDANIYNHSTKNLFLETLKNESSRNAFKSMLTQISKYEKEIDKNFYDMSINEAKNCIDTLTRTTLNASSTLLSKLSTYLFWTIANNFSENSVLLSWVKTLKGSDIVSKTAMENQYITKKDLYNIMSLIRNAQDKALLTLLFHGVEGTELYELRHISKSDIDFNNNLIHLKEHNKATYNRDVKLSVQEMDIVKEALEQTSYYLVDIDEKGKEAIELLSLTDSDYLFKVIEFTKKRRATASDIVTRAELSRRLRGISQEVKNPLNAGNLIASGMIYELTQLNKEFEDITDDDYIYILKKYNKKINTSSIVSLRDLYKYLLKNEIEVAIAQE